MLDGSVIGGRNHLEQLFGLAGQAGSHSRLLILVNGAPSVRERIGDGGRLI